MGLAVQPFGYQRFGWRLQAQQIETFGQVLYRPGKGLSLQGAVWERLSNGEWNMKYEVTGVGDNDDQVGASVALDGEQVVFGAPGDDQVVEDGGAAYVFDLTGSSLGTARPEVGALVGDVSLTEQVTVRVE